MDLRAAGLSRQKARYARLWRGRGWIMTPLRALPDDEVVARLVALPGIGRWTAEIYAMFSLGRADVFAPGDLACRRRRGCSWGLRRGLGERALRALAEDWAPWRAVAARRSGPTTGRRRAGKGMRG
jgi:DNA-3-methyladenine glycosylase II